MRAPRSLLVAALAIIATGTQIPAPAPAISNAILAHPRSRQAWPGVTSTNWSGYGGVTSAGYHVTSTSARWRVPSVVPGSGFSSSWVGIDGFNNKSLIQTGTDQYAGRGGLTYRAWWEILPAPETVIHSLTISPGDSMIGTVEQVAGTSWRITLEDLTTGRSFSTKKTYTGPGTSAEWIEEAPTGDRGTLRLADYSRIKFSNITLGLNGSAPSKVALQFPGEAIAMVRGKARISTPSRPKGNAFNIAYGPTQPPPP